MDKVAILIDGGFYLKRLPRVREDIDIKSPESVANSIRQLVRGHLRMLAETQQISTFEQKNPRAVSFTEPHWYARHYRTLYYDAEPLQRKTAKPISGRRMDFSKSAAYNFRKTLFDELRKQRNTALRLGETKEDPEYIWQLRPSVLRAIINSDRERKFSSLTDDDFVATIRQKGVDMRMGLDMATIALKKQANVIVVVTGDADFVSPIKMARREGCQIILDPLWQKSPQYLSEHIDGLQSAFPKPKAP